MSIRAMSSVWENSQHKGGKLLLLLALADFSNEKGFAFPSIETLSARSRMTPRNVQLILNELVESKELEIMRGQGPHGCNLYRILLNNSARRGGEKISGGEISGPKTSSPPDEIPGLEISPNPSGTVIRESLVSFPIVPKSVFQKPSIDEVKDYAGELGMAMTDAEAFFDHFESNGWLVGGRTKMRDWKAALRNWQRNTNRFTAGRNGYGSPKVAKKPWE